MASPQHPKPYQKGTSDKQDSTRGTGTSISRKAGHEKRQKSFATSQGKAEVIKCPTCSLVARLRLRREAVDRMCYISLQHRPATKIFADGYCNFSVSLVYCPSTDVWGISTVGSARHSHCRGQEFESPMLHHGAQIRTRSAILRNRICAYVQDSGRVKPPLFCRFGVHIRGEILDPINFTSKKFLLRGKKPRSIFLFPIIIGKNRLRTRKL